MTLTAMRQQKLADYAAAVRPARWTACSAALSPPRRSKLAYQGQGAARTILTAWRADRRPSSITISGRPWKTQAAACAADRDDPGQALPTPTAIGCRRRNCRPFELPHTPIRLPVPRPRHCRAGARCTRIPAPAPVVDARKPRLRRPALLTPQQARRPPAQIDRHRRLPSRTTRRRRAEPAAAADTAQADEPSVPVMKRDCADDRRARHRCRRTGRTTALVPRTLTADTDAARR